MPFSARALILWWKTSGNVNYRGLCSYRRRVRVITLFPNIFFPRCFCLLSEFAKVLERKVWCVQVAHLHNAVRAPSILFWVKFSLEFKWFLSYIQHNFHILPLKSVIPTFVACLVFLGMTFSFIELIPLQAQTQNARRPLRKLVVPP